MTRAELLERCSSAELTGWQAYELETGPFGGERDDTLAAMTAYYVCRALGAKVDAAKLLPQWTDRAQRRRRSGPMDWRAMKAAAELITRVNGGRVR